jgi:hypothetical protein
LAYVLCLCLFFSWASACTVSSFSEHAWSEKLFSQTSLSNTIWIALISLHSFAGTHGGKEATWMMSGNLCG